MIILPYDQGSPEWLQARAGLPTASEFHRICTSARMEYSKKGSRSYAMELLQERKQGKPRSKQTTQWMDRGSIMEDQALSCYSLLNDCDLTRVGLCLTDTKKYGASPDALIPEQRTGVEAKNCDLDTHLGYILDNILPIDHRIQVYGNLLVTEYDRWDFISYHPDEKPFLISTYRVDIEEELATLGGYLDRFCNELIRYRAKIDKY